MRLNKEVEIYKKEHVLKLYRKHPDEVKRDLIKETNTQGDYEGREILELLQNAVDQVDSSGKIFIELRDSMLTVANTGEPFSFEGVKSLMKSDLSPKSENNDNIGQKGLGFRSLLNWSRDISIYSDELSIRFTEDYRKQYFTKENIDEQTALLVVPEIVLPIDKKDYTTVIKINISNKDQIEEVKRQLLNIDKYTLLFLDKISDLIVCVNEKKISFKREKDSDIVMVTANGEEFIFETFTETGKINGRKYEIIIAYDDELVAEENKLYSFFETTVDFPIKWKVHATFDLNMDRNTIKRSEENLELLRKVARFICNSATKIGNSKSYDGFDSLIKKSEFPASLDIRGKHFDDIFRKEVENTLILPILTGEKTSLIKAPALYEKIPFFFKNIEKYEVLRSFSNKTEKDIYRRKILEEYCSKFDDIELKDIINIKSQNWSIERQVEVFLWWYNNYSESEVLPHLLKDKTEKWINKKDKIFLDGNVIGEFPGSNWVTGLKIISRKYQDELTKQLSYNDDFNRIDGETKTRKLYNWLNRKARLSFIEQTTESIISPINASINGDYERSKEFLSWLFECYSNPENTLDVSKINTELNLPTSNGEVVRASKLFLGKDYNNNLGTSLFRDTDYQELISLKNINIKKEEIINFIEFSKKVHVLEFPLIERTQIADPLFESKFIEPTIHKYLERINETRDCRVRSYEFDNISNFENLIKQLETSDIIKWLDNDYKFQNQIINHQPFGTVKYRIGQKWSDDTYSGNTPSYIKYLLNKTPWIEINYQKYAPNQIVFYEKLGQNIPGICGIKKEQLLELGLSDEVVDKLDFKQDVSKLLSEEIYEILKFLNNSTDSKGEISKHIYGKILDNIENIADIPNYTANDIEIFCKDGKYYPCEQVKYAINRPPSSDKKTHFINIAYRKNSKIIEHWFGVKPYEFESKYKNHLVSGKHQKEYEKEEKNIITTVSALSKLTDDNLDKIKRIKIILCTGVENSEDVKLGDYDYANIENNFYLKIPDINYCDLLRNKNFIESFIDIYISKLRINIDKDKVELFLSKDLEEQKQRLFNDYDVNWKEYYDKLWDSSSLTNKVLDWFSLVIIDFDKSAEYEKIKEINFYNLDLSSQDYELIIDLLKKSKKYISDLDKIININLIPFYKKNIEKYINQNEDKYTNNCYYLAKNASAREQMQYLENIQCFRNYRPNKEKIKNSINFDYKKMVIHDFPALDRSYNLNVDISGEYDNNVRFLMEKLKIDSDDFDYFIQNHEEFKSLLYFGVPNNIEYEIIKFLNSDNIIDDEITNSYSINDEETSTIDISLQKVAVNHKNENTRGERSKKDYDSQNDDKDKAGEIAEDIAYLELRKIYTDLIWHSKYSKRPSDRNKIPTGNIVCDMWVRNHFNGNIYFEIKSSKDGFIMSSSEYESMKANKDNYEVVLVDRENKTISRHKFNELDKLKTTNQYIFQFKKVKE